jgi:hypothetical protein
MSGSIAKLLRLMVQGDKEAVVSAVSVTGTPTKFTSKLPAKLADGYGYGRRKMYAYNNSDGASGEVGYGYSATITIADAMPLPVGEKVWIPVSEDVDVYFVGVAAGSLNVRVEEIA